MKLADFIPAPDGLELPDEPIRALGIDLGTTNSVVAEARWSPEAPDTATVRCLEVEQPTEQGTFIGALVPSVVALAGGELFVGEGAKAIVGDAPARQLRRNEQFFFECKNDMGTRRRYLRAPEDFRSPAEIGKQVVSFLLAAAERTGHERAVVTVPASFQVAQRRSTTEAGRLSGLRMTDGDLLDEPLAAFLDYLFHHGAELNIAAGATRKLVVFDFGGGTCDVAVFELARHSNDHPIGMTPLAVSRYHRLGGGDIDAAIVFEVLIPQLIEQNGLSAFDLTFDDKKNFAEPALRSIAEALKIGLCRELDRLAGLSLPKSGNRSEIVKSQPGVHYVPLRGRKLALRSPSLTAAQYDTVMEPFLDQDMLFARSTEYRMTCSIFAPLEDALERCGVRHTEIDYCLLAGGSSSLPGLPDRIRDFFPRTCLLRYDDRHEAKLAVARGAALHALALRLTGRGLIEPICHDDIALRVQGGRMSLLSCGTALPYPASGFAVLDRLAAPADAEQGSVDLRVEIVTGRQGRVLFSQIWPIPAPVSRNEPLRLEYRLDANQVLELHLRKLEPGRGGTFSGRIENPLSHVVNPIAEELKIEEIEQDLQTGKIRPEERIEKFIELADRLHDIGRSERAADIVRAVLRQKNRPDAGLLNKLGVICNDLRDYERAERAYREAAQADPGWGGSLFNLALSLRRQGRVEEAVAAADSAIVRDPNGPSCVLRALLAGQLRDERGRQEHMARAMRSFGNPAHMSKWELAWFLTAARAMGDTAATREAENEQRRRNDRQESAGAEGELPIVSSDRA